jgi:hypothetical protein
MVDLAPGEEIRMMPISLLRVLFDPVAYFRPWQGNALVSRSPSVRSGLNAYLVRRYQLPGYAPVAPDQHAAVEQLLRGWFDIDRAAYLVACAKQSRRVMASRHAARLAPGVHAFMRLGFAQEHTLPPPARVDDDSLLAWGGHYLSALTPQLPVWLGRRLRLFFEGTPAMPRTWRSLEPVDLTCIWSALNYASRDPGIGTGCRA